MSAEIAVATLSVKAYFLLVTELRRRHLNFRCLKPTDQLPAGINVVLTSLREEKCFAYKNVLANKESDDPSEVVDKALMILMGKIYFRELVVGVDLGKTIGLALIEDRRILRTKSRTTVEEAMKDILKFFERFKLERRLVRVGKGATKYHQRLIMKILSAPLSESMLKLVDKGETTKTSKSMSLAIPLDEEAAIRIAKKRGERI